VGSGVVPGVFESGRQNHVGHPRIPAIRRRPQRPMTCRPTRRDIWPLYLGSGRSGSSGRTGSSGSTTARRQPVVVAWPVVSPDWFSFGISRNQAAFGRRDCNGWEAGSALPDVGRGVRERQSRMPLMSLVAEWVRLVCSGRRRTAVAEWTQWRGEGAVRCERHQLRGECFRFIAVATHNQWRVSSCQAQARGYTRFKTMRTALLLIAGKLDFSAFNSHAR